MHLLLRSSFERSDASNRHALAPYPRGLGPLSLGCAPQPMSVTPPSLFAQPLSRVRDLGSVDQAGWDCHYGQKQEQDQAQSQTSGGLIPTARPS